MATFALIPGGWHGGWYFEPLARTLREHGHTARPVTLTGVGDRAQLLSGTVNLDTHITDVVRLLEAERIEDAILVGHSYGGMVVSGVADRAPDRVDALVYCDAYVPEDGDSCWSLTSDAFRTAFRDGWGADGCSVAPVPGLDPRATENPLASFLQRIRLTGGLDRFRRRDYVYLSGWSNSPFVETYRRLRDDPAWHTHELPVGHDVLRAAPDEPRDILLATV